MTRLSRWLAPAVLASLLGVGGTVAMPAQGQDDAVVRVVVDVADVVLRSGQPYYRYGHDGPYDRLVVRRDRYGRPVYYRVVPRQVYYGGGDYRHDRSGYTGFDPYNYRPPSSRVSCSSSGNCTVKYYDPNQDRRGHDAGGRWNGNHGNGRGHHGDRDD